MNNGGPVNTVPAFVLIKGDMDAQAVRTLSKVASMSEGKQGLTIRDYFAAKAMQSLMVREDYGFSDKNTAKLAYESADAMLVEREKP